MCVQYSTSASCSPIIQMELRTGGGWRMMLLHFTLHLYVCQEHRTKVGVQQMHKTHQITPGKSRIMCRCVRVDSFVCTFKEENLQPSCISFDYICRPYTYLTQDPEVWMKVYFFFPFFSSFFLVLRSPCCLCSLVCVCVYVCSIDAHIQLSV